MPDIEENKQSDFMIEKIKKRPVNKKKLLRRTVITAAMAVIFGSIACLTFLILEPVISNRLYPEEKPQYVEFPEETDEMLPEDMIVEETEPEPEIDVEAVLLESGQIEEILSRVVLGMENYKQLYAAMSEYTIDLSRSMVTVTGIASDTDWLQNTSESTMQVSGVIVANNGVELLILADNRTLKKADSIFVTFCDGQRAQAVQKQQDAGTELAVFAVQLSDMMPETVEQVMLAELGSSNSRSIVGMPVVAMGSPMGVSNSVEYGMITATGSRWSTTDANYNLLFTDMHAAPNASGMLFNMQRQVVGIITTDKGGADIQNINTAIGISELRKIISRMSNGRPAAYMGISGVDVTQQINEEIGVPFGAYVQEISMESPAMLAGIQRGDIIVQIEDMLIGGFNDYTTALLRFKPGDTVDVVVQRQVQDGYKEVEFEVVLTEG